MEDLSAWTAFKSLNVSSWTLKHKCYWRCKTVDAWWWMCNERCHWLENVHAVWNLYKLREVTFCLPALKELNWCYMPLCPANCIFFPDFLWSTFKKCTHCNVCKAQIVQSSISQISICPQKTSIWGCLPKRFPAQFKLYL